MRTISKGVSSDTLGSTFLISKAELLTLRIAYDPMRSENQGQGTARFHFSKNLQCRRGRTLFRSTFTLRENGR